MSDLLLTLPELYIAAAGMLLLLFGAFVGEGSLRRVTFLTVIAFAVTLFLIWWEPKDGTAFGGMFKADAFARLIKSMILVAGAGALALAPSYLEKVSRAKPEYPVLVLFAVLGMMIMASANDLISLYLGLELQNLALYVLAAFRRDDGRSSEAGLKYFTLSALSSAILLFGLSLIYGFAGTTSFAQLALLVTPNAAHVLGLATGVVFMLAGFAFKVSAVPFHMWTPDVYEGAPTPTAAFLASAPKIAGLALLTRVLVQPMAGAVELWQPVLMFLAAASMLLGGFAGLLQTNLKRLLAFSAIANVGTMLVGLAAYHRGEAALPGLQGLILYLALYFVGTLGAFGVLLSLRRNQEPIEEIADLAGLGKTRPALAAAMGASLFSLAGVPPLAGFFGKYFVLQAAVQGHILWLAVLGVLASVVAAAYYIRVVKVMYFDEVRGLPLDPVSDRAMRFIVMLTALAVLLFVLVPAPLMNAARIAAESLIAR